MFADATFLMRRSAACIHSPRAKAPFLSGSTNMVYLWSSSNGLPPPRCRAKSSSITGRGSTVSIVTPELVTPFQPVSILDLPLEPDTAALANLASGKPYLFIFWSDERPVGKLWCAANETPADAVSRFLNTIALPVRPEPISPPPASVSVVICTRDRPDELARCLASLPAQSRPPDEIIVVDNASREDRTREVAAAAGVTYLREDRPGLDIARNTGALAARSEIVAYTDDDTELHPNWLENLAAAFDRDDVAAVTGLVLPAQIESEAQWLFEAAWSFGRGFERIDYEQTFYRESRSLGCPAWKVGAGASMAFRREIFDEIGLFDERLDVGAAGCSGDSEFWYRVLAAGYTCRYEPTAVVRHYHRLGMEGLESQIYHYMRGHYAALMVQYERTRDIGNLRLAFVTVPRHFLRLALERIRQPPTPRSRLLRQQVRGSISGLFYYFRAPKPKN